MTRRRSSEARGRRFGVGRALILMLPLGVAVGGCSRSEARGSAPKRDVRIPVEVRPAVRVTRTRQVTALAVAAPWRQVVLRSEVAARVVQLRVRVGDSVRTGQRLLTLDGGSAWAALRSRKAAIRQSEVSVRKAAVELARVRRLVASGDLPRAQLDQAQAAYDAAVAARDLARSQLRETGAQLARFTVRAPFAGVIAQRHVEPGDYVAPGGALLTLADRSRLRLVVGVAPEDAQGLVPGAVAWVRTRGRRLKAAVYRIRPMASGTTRRVEVEVSLPNPPAPGVQAIVPGTVVTVVLPVGDPESLLRVPSQAVVRRAADHVLFSVRDGAAVAVPVAIVSADAHATYVRPLRPGAVPRGARIVVAGAARLAPGAQVLVTSPVERPAPR